MRHFIIPLCLSLAINAATFVTIGEAVKSRAVFVAKQKAIKGWFKPARELTLEFVEAPKQVSTQKPVNPKKISTRDTISQDTSKSKKRSANTPAIAKVGPADQLTQIQSQGKSVPPQPEIKPQSASKAQLEHKPAPPNKVEKVSAESKSSPQNDAMESVPYKSSKAQPDRKEIRPSAATTPLMSGGDKISTQAMTKKRGAGARMEGMTSFEATGSGMGAYMKNLKERVWLQWYPYLAFQYPIDSRSADAVISFVIDKRGEVKQVQVVESYGSPQFADFCMQAIQKASGFGELPTEIRALIGKDELEMKFAFHYR